jgi:hypothetical protein
LEDRDGRSCVVNVCAMVQSFGSVSAFLHVGIVFLFLAGGMFSNFGKCGSPQ